MFTNTAWKNYISVGLQRIKWNEGLLLPQSFSFYVVSCFKCKLCTCPPPPPQDEIRQLGVANSCIADKFHAKLLWQWIHANSAWFYNQLNSICYSVDLSIWMGIMSLNSEIIYQYCSNRTSWLQKSRLHWCSPTVYRHWQNSKVIFPWFLKSMFHWVHFF